MVVMKMIERRGLSLDVRTETMASTINKYNGNDPAKLGCPI